MSKHRRRRRHEERRRLIEEWEKTGESADAFAARIGVASNTLYRWRRTVVTSAAPKTSEPTLSRIVEVRTAAMAADTRFEVDVGGRRVRVPASFDEEALARLLRVVEAAR